ncbi:MAG: carbamoyl-phosphate synthase large subunit [Bdellovibrionales bacterium]|nr:carbamoyl-phosphate synthase large subunit [Bdellovibrionales bacterium]
MPKRTDLKSILVLGSGPIVIGQACEFDYSGTQAIKSLKEEGYRVILANSNPATIMTDPIYADATYIEPLTFETLSSIIEKERPDAILPTVGGQTALNLAMKLHEGGVLEAFNVELLGARVESIQKAENREMFKKCMQSIGVPLPKSRYVRSIEEAREAMDYVKIPAIIRPSFTLGGAGASMAYNQEEYEKLVRWGIDSSPVGEILIEESILGWKEFELEMMRDKNDNVVVICSIENFDPVGVHTGDSITVAPAQTLSDTEYQKLRDYSIQIMRAIGVDSGGSNIQFAVNPVNGQIYVIEMNPRVSRSSALASKATGYPIAKLAAKLAVGYTLDEVPNDITRNTKASFEPTIDYVVTKIPRFDFGKFAGSARALGPQMKAVGEVMGIGHNFAESLQKAIRSLELDLFGLRFNSHANSDDLKTLLGKMRTALPERLLFIGEALSKGATVEDIVESTSIDPWFIHQLKRIVDSEELVRVKGVKNLTSQDWRYIKRLGFADRHLARIADSLELTIRETRQSHGIKPVYKMVDTCAAEFESHTNYLYSTYGTEDESPPTQNKKVMILGSGPNRIGQGIEFDYCCVHASLALKKMGVESIMVNCNPETVSTDFDISDRLYFEPLTFEDVSAIIDREKPLGVILQFGGQTPLKLAKSLEESGVTILGTSPEAIDIAEDRERFRELLERLKISQPQSFIAHNKEEAYSIAESLGFPMMIRPSYVLGGRSMKVVFNTKELSDYLETETVSHSLGGQILMDRFLENSIEVDVDALCDGSKTYIAGIMQHVEEAGVHSGDSSCVLPPFSIEEKILEEIQDATNKIAIALDVKGFINIQFAIQKDHLFVLEVNPRASRTVPFVSKATGLTLVQEAVDIMLGGKINAQTLNSARNKQLYCVKSPVFPFLKFNNVDTILGPEMKSTGEVMGVDSSWELAYGKAQIAAGNLLPRQGTVFISVNDQDKEQMVEIAKLMRQSGFTIVSTRGTAKHLIKHGVPAEKVNKVVEGRPHIVDAILNRKIDLVFNTTLGKDSIRDSYSIRRSTLEKGIPYFTTIQGSWAAAHSIQAIRQGKLSVYALQEFKS